MKKIKCPKCNYKIKEIYSNKYCQCKQITRLDVFYSVVMDKYRCVKCGKIVSDEQEELLRERFDKVITRR